MNDSHIRKRRLVLSVGVLLGVTFVATFGIVAVNVSNSVGKPLWDSWSAHSDRLTQEEVRGARIEKEAREQTYKTLCPAYFEASFFDRWLRYRDLRWCGSFRDRMTSHSSEI